MPDNLFGFTANLIDAAFIVCGNTSKILNARGIRLCFLIDIFCLGYWTYIDIERNLYSQAIGAIVSILICIYGYRRWGKINEK